MVTVIMNAASRIIRIFAPLGDVVDLGKTEDPGTVTRASMAIILKLMGVKTAHSLTFRSCYNLLSSSAYYRVNIDSIVIVYTSGE